MVSTAQKGNTKQILITPQTIKERPEPGLIAATVTGQSQQIAQGPGTHGSKIRQIDPQQLAGNLIRGIIVQKMDTLGHHVFGDDQFTPCSRDQCRAIIGKPLRTGRSRQRRDQPINQIELIHRPPSLV